MLERVWRKGNPLHYWWERKLAQPLWKNSMEVPQKLNPTPEYIPRQKYNSER